MENKCLMFSANPPDVRDSRSSTMTSNNSRVMAHRVKKCGIPTMNGVSNTVGVDYLPRSEYMTYLEFSNAPT